MRTYTWKEYFEQYYDWTDCTKIQRLSQLTNVGPVAEVVEVIIDLDCDHQNAANALLKKAVDAGMQFSAEDLCQFCLDMDHELVHRALLQSIPSFNTDSIEDLYGTFDEEDIREVCCKGRVPLPEEMREEELPDDIEDTVDDLEELVDYERCMPKIGFFTKLALAIGLADMLGHFHDQQHKEVCDGDCAHCPPHYGYRYGQWYYGHHHDYGCEFDGNDREP